MICCRCSEPFDAECSTQRYCGLCWADEDECDDLVVFAPLPEHIQGFENVEGVE